MRKSLRLTNHIETRGDAALQQEIQQLLTDGRRLNQVAAGQCHGKR
jgi:hypothetical protein